MNFWGLRRVEQAPPQFHFWRQLPRLPNQQPQRIGRIELQFPTEHHGRTWCGLLQSSRFWLRQLPSRRCDQCRPDDALRLVRTAESYIVVRARQLETNAEINSQFGASVVIYIPLSREIREL